MKKTLIALAAVAATGASFAQVTMTGNIGFSWQQSPAVSSSGQHVQGFAIQDGEIYITAKEDLGDGWAATARGGFTMRGRGNGIADRDATVQLTTPLGAVTTGALRACGSIMAQQSGVVTGTVYSSNESVNAVPIDKCSIVNVLTLTTKLSDYTLSATYGEFEGGATGLSSNDRGNATGITFTALAAEYGNGPLVVGGDWTAFAAATVYTTASASQPYVYNSLLGVTNGQVISAAGSNYLPVDGANRYRLYGKYDAGFAKFAAGYQMQDKRADQYIASVAVPYGNFTFGLDYLGRNEQTYAPKDLAEALAAYLLTGARYGDKASSAIGIGATYNFSKTTTLNASYLSYTDAGANSKYKAISTSSATGTTLATFNTAGTTAASLDTEYRIRLMKSF